MTPIEAAEQTSGEADMSSHIHAGHIIDLGSTRWVVSDAKNATHEMAHEAAVGAACSGSVGETLSISDVKDRQIAERASVTVIRTFPETA